MLTHRSARLGFSVQKLYEKNEALHEESVKYTAEQLDLRNTLMALLRDEKLDSLYDIADDGQLQIKTYGNIRGVNCKISELSSCRFTPFCC